MRHVLVYTFYPMEELVREVLVRYKEKGGDRTHLCTGDVVPVRRSSLLGEQGES